MHTQGKSASLCHSSRERASTARSGWCVCMKNELNSQRARQTETNSINHHVLKRKKKLQADWEIISNSFIESLSAIRAAAEKAEKKGKKHSQCSETRWKQKILCFKSYLSFVNNNSNTIRVPPPKPTDVFNNNNNCLLLIFKCSN